MNAEGLINVCQAVTHGNSRQVLDGIFFGGAAVMFRLSTASVGASSDCYIT